MKKVVFILALVVSALLFGRVQLVSAAGTDVSVECSLSSCTVTPSLVPVFDEHNIWPGFAVTHSITAQNITVQNGQFGLVAREYEGRECDGDGQGEGDEVSAAACSLLSNHIFIEIHQGSAGGPLVYGGGSSKTLADLFADTASNQIVLGAIGPIGSDQYFVTATFDPDAGNELMNTSVTFDLDLGFVFTPIGEPTPPGGNGNPGGSSNSGCAIEYKVVGRRSALIRRI